MSLTEHARIELEALVNSVGYTGESTGIEPFIDDIIKLVENILSTRYESRLNKIDAAYIGDIIQKLLRRENLQPIFGIDSEWVLVSPKTYADPNDLYQNKRCANLFKKNNDCPFYMDAIHWYDIDKKQVFTGEVESVSSSQYISGFPFHPVTYTIPVRRLDVCGDVIVDVDTLQKVFSTTYSPSIKLTGEYWYVEYFARTHGIVI